MTSLACLLFRGVLFSVWEADWLAAVVGWDSKLLLPPHNTTSCPELEKSKHWGWSCPEVYKLGLTSLVKEILTLALLPPPCE